MPSFVLLAGVPVRLGSRTVPADIAFGGAFYAIVDSEAAGIPIAPSGSTICGARAWRSNTTIESKLTIEHPEEPRLHGIYGTIFTGPASSPDADLRNVTIFADAEVDRSPCGTGTCAVMAVLSAMGLLAPEQTFTHESIIGTRFRGRVERESSGRQSAGDRSPTRGRSLHDRKPHFCNRRPDDPLRSRLSAVTLFVAAEV